MSETELVLYGTVGDSWWGEPAFNATTVRDALRGIDGDLRVRLNSGGGVAPEGQAIYNILSAHPGKVTIEIEGIAASAASLIAMAGDEIVMLEGAVLMIHDPAQPWIEGRGTEDDHLRAAATLALLSKAYAKIYAKRSGMTVDEAREIMRAETYYDGESAVAAGFATRVAEKQAEAVAAFDYAVYAHAPKELLDAGAGLARRDGRRAAVAALMAGIKPNPKRKEAKMATEDETIAGDGEDTLTVDDQDSLAVNGEDTMEGDGDDTVETPETGEDEGDDENTATAVAILDACDLANAPELARDMIARRLTLPQVMAELRNYKGKGTTMSAKPGAPRTTILRDERETSRIGMTAAIVAQITRAAPVDGNARRFMNHPLYQMAAEAAGYRGSLRTPGAREEAFRMAYHSNSDFPGILDGAMNKVLLERYQAAEPIYRRIARRRDVKDFRPTSFVRAGDFPMMKKVVEGGNIEFGTIGESAETLTLGAFASGARITRQVLINDDLGALEETLSDYGAMVARFEEATFFAAINGNLADGNPVYHASRGNLAGSGGAIDVTTISAGREAIRKQTSINGQKLNLAPAILLVGPSNETAAEQLVAVITAAQPGNVNPFSGKLTVEQTPEITGDEWYLLASPSVPGGSVYSYGFLEGAAAPRIRTEEPFGQQGLAITCEHDFVAGPIDFRGGYKNPGA